MRGTLFGALIEPGSDFAMMPLLTEAVSVTALAREGVSPAR
jgi:hypothetical protein